MEESNRQKWERYIQNLRRVRTLSRPQFPPETAPEFLLEAIQSNAVRCFDRMKENNALLGELVYTRDAKMLSDSDIAELEEAAGRLFNYANSEDCGVAYKIHELLLKAARFRDDVPMIVRELYYNGITLHYINVRDEDHDVNLLWPRIHAFFLEGANYIARYEELDKETRQYIIRCVGNLRLAVSRQTKEDCHRYMELFDLAMGIITSPYYQELDPDIPWARFTYSMHMDQMTLMAYLRHCNDPEVAERVLRSASYVYEHQKKNAGEESRQQNWRVSYFYHAALYHAGKGTARAVVEDLLEIISQTGEQDYSPDGINRNLTGAAYLFYYEAFLSEQDRAELADRIAKERAAAHRYLDEMPGNEYPRVASVAIRELITAQSDTKEIDNRKILESILFGHKPTYVHSTMVAHLTRVLLRRMVETDPAALIGLLGCKTAAEVQARKPELLQTAYECGLYHDVGKSAVIMYIDTNSRSLLEEEFCCIQSHPVHWLQSAAGGRVRRASGPGGALSPLLLQRTGRLPQRCAALPAGHQGHRGCADRGGLAGCRHRQHRALLQPGQAPAHTGGGAAGPERHPLCTGRGGAVPGQDLLRSAGPKAGCRAKKGLSARIPRCGIKK